MEITAKVTLVNGKAIGDKNIAYITARSIRENTTNYEYGHRVKNYFNRYRAIKESAGYIFREVRFGNGISGHYPTLRALVLDTIITYGHDIKVSIR